MTARNSIESGFVEELTNSETILLPPLFKRLFSVKRDQLSRFRKCRSTIKKHSKSEYRLANAFSDTCLSGKRGGGGGGSSEGVADDSKHPPIHYRRKPSVECLDDTGDARNCDLSSALRRHSYQPKRTRCLSVADFDRIENYMYDRLTRALSEPSLLSVAMDTKIRSRRSTLNRSHVDRLHFSEDIGGIDHNGDSATHNLLEIPTPVL